MNEEKDVALRLKYVTHAAAQRIMNNPACKVISMCVIIQEKFVWS